MSKNVTYLNPEGAPPAQGMYSHAAKVPGMPLYYIAGQLAVGQKGEVVGKGDFRAQFKQIITNLEGVLASLGMKSTDIIKFNTYLVHSQDIETFMELRAAAFPKLFPQGVYPPNTLVIVDRLVKEDFLLEIECTAYAGSN